MDILISNMIFMVINSHFYMMRLLTVNEIIKRFRTSGSCTKFSPKTITYMARKLGYKPKHAGAKLGYDKSLITAISQHFREALEYEDGLKEKLLQKPLKQPITKPRELDYFAYNGEKYRPEYWWEKDDDYELEENELIFNKIIMEEINKFLYNKMILC